MITPFGVKYQEIVEQIKICSATVDSLANAGARAEIRHVRVLQELDIVRSNERDAKLQEMQTKIDRMMKIVVSSKTLTERISVDVVDVKQGISRIEYHHVVDFLAPKLSPAAALLKVRSLTKRDLTPGLEGPGNLKVYDVLHTWATAPENSLLVVRVGPRAQMQAKELTVNVIEKLNPFSKSIYWNISSSRDSVDTDSIADVLKAILSQILEHSRDLFAQFAEQLDLAKIHGRHSEDEWADLICLLLSKLPEAFFVIESEALQKAYQHDSTWAERFCGLLEKLVNRASLEGSRLKILFVVHSKTLALESDSRKARIVALQPNTPVPPRLRHVARRSGLNSRGWKLQRPKV